MTTYDPITGRLEFSNDSVCGRRERLLKHHESLAAEARRYEAEELAEGNVDEAEKWAAQALMHDGYAAIERLDPIIARFSTAPDAHATCSDAECNICRGDIHVIGANPDLI